MNVKIKFLMIAFVATISILSCKKSINWNGSDPNSGPKNCKLATLQTDLGLFGQYNINYTYDDLGRLIKQTEDGESTTYGYSSTKLTVTNADGSVGEIILSNGRASSSKGITMISVNGSLTIISRIYTYNADGYLEIVKSYADGVLSSTDVLSYTNGNLSKSILTFEANNFVGVRVVTTNFSYSSDVVKMEVDVVDPLVGSVDYFPGGYFGKTSKNILTKIESATVVNGAQESSEVINNSYIFDSKGNPTLITSKSVSTTNNSAGTPVTNDYSLTYKLSYNCK